MDDFLCALWRKCHWLAMLALTAGLVLWHSGFSWPYLCLLVVLVGCCRAIGSEEVSLAGKRIEFQARQQVRAEFWQQARTDPSLRPGFVVSKGGRA